MKIRRERGDLIEFYKIVHKLEEVKWVNEIKRLDIENDNRPTLRRHRDHFYRESKACTVREKFFINRVIPLWNGLPAVVRDASGLDSFKARIDGLARFSVNGCHGSNQGAILEL